LLRGDNAAVIHAALVWTPPLQNAVAVSLIRRHLLIADRFVYAAIGISAIGLWWLCLHDAAHVPLWAPWDFSFAEYLGCWLVAWWYARGVALTGAAERPGLLRHLSFFLGLGVIYAVLQTQFEYLAEHQFFYNRAQHVAMHHVGPLLIALAWPGVTLARGMPRMLRKIITDRAVLLPIRVLQQPVLATVLFSGTFFFWLIPAVHFRAMINPQLYALMNWTMVIEGILFWCLVLDPRPSPPARASFATRAVLSVVVMFPQIIGGAMIAFNPRDLYTFYDLCGRIYPAWGAHYDQTLGGLIMWIPPAMMSIIALLIVLNMLRKSDEKRAADIGDDGRPAIDASQWTGMR
jgi:putative membrane protein